MYDGWERKRGRFCVVIIDEVARLCPLSCDIVGIDIVKIRWVYIPMWLIVKVTNNNGI